MAVDVRVQYEPPSKPLCGVLENGAGYTGLEPVTFRSRGGDSDVPLAFRLNDGTGAERTRVEDYIAAQFHQFYGARIRHFMPWLLSYGKGSEMHGVLGLRRASHEPLFLEQYLDEPVEAQLGAVAGTPVARTDIVEIGNLVATARGGSRLLFLMLAELFAAVDLTWAIFTATPEVHHLLQKLTDNQHFLCYADGARLGPELADWGSYYATRPAVIAINVKAERERLLERPLVKELLQVCRPQAQAFARLMNQEGL